jgi:hypothetical protein
MNQAKTISIVTGALTVGLAGAAFTLSFNSLTELAGQQGLSVPVLFPLILEGGLITFSLTALDRQLTGQSTRVQWLMVIGCSLTATVFNVLHAPANILPRVMWAIPSVILLLAFESFLTQLRYRVNRSVVANSRSMDNTDRSTDSQQASPIASQQISTPVSLVNEPATIPVNLTPVNRVSRSTANDIDDRRERVLAGLTAGLTIGQIAANEGVSVGTIKNDKRQLNGRVIK